MPPRTTTATTLREQRRTADARRTVAALRGDEYAQRLPDTDVRALAVALTA